MASFYDDSIAKELHLRFMQATGQTNANGIPTFELFELVENDRIESESMSFTMGILEGTKFKLGSYVVPEMTVTFSYNGNRYKDKYVRVWLTQENDVTIHGLIFGKVYQEILSENREKITVTIRNILYDVFNTYVDWNDTFFYGVPSNDGTGGAGVQVYMRSIEDFYRILIKHTISYACGVYDKSLFEYRITTSQINDKLSFLENRYANFKTSGSPVLSDIIKYVGKLNDASGIYALDYNQDKRFNLGYIWQCFGEMAAVHWIISKPNYSSASDIEADTIQYQKDVDIDPIRITEINILVPSETLYPISNSTTPLLPLTGRVSVYSLYDYDIHSLPYYISCKYDEYVKTKYNSVKYDDGLQMLDNDIPIYEALPYEFSNNNVFFDNAYSTSVYGGYADGYEYRYGNEENRPTWLWATNIENLKGINHYNTTLEISQYSTTAKDYLLNLDKIIYAVLDCVFDTDLELDDCVLIETADNTTIVIPLISCQINGINLLIATYKTTAIAES